MYFVLSASGTFFSPAHQKLPSQKLTTALLACLCTRYRSTGRRCAQRRCRRYAARTTLKPSRIATDEVFRQIMTGQPSVGWTMDCSSSAVLRTAWHLHSSVDIFRFLFLPPLAYPNYCSYATLVSIFPRCFWLCDIKVSRLSFVHIVTTNYPFWLYTAGHSNYWLPIYSADSFYCDLGLYGHILFAFIFISFVLRMLIMIFSNCYYSETFYRLYLRTLWQSILYDRLYELAVTCNK